MSVVLTADPLPTITWTKHNKEVKEDGHVKLTSEVKELEHGLKEIKYSLHLPQGRHIDTGDYVIKAENKYGAAESGCHLDILLKPEIEGFKEKTCMPFEQVIFQVFVRANPKPKVTWTKDNQNLCNNDNCDVIADVDKEIYT